MQVIHGISLARNNLNGYGGTEAGRVSGEDTKHRKDRSRDATLAGQAGTRPLDNGRECRVCREVWPAGRLVGWLQSYAVPARYRPLGGAVPANLLLPSRTPFVPLYLLDGPTGRGFNCRWLRLPPARSAV